MSYFIKKINRTSKEQLKKDFGEFPPKPFNCCGPKLNFTLVHLHDLGDEYYKLKWMLASIFSNIEVKDDELFDSNDHRVAEGNVSAVRDYIESIKTNFSKSNLLAKIATFLFFSIFLPIFSIFYCFWIFIKSIKNIRSKKGALGYHLPAINNDYRIVVLPNKIRRSDSCVEAVISHEHIHLLQYFDRVHSYSNLEKIDFRKKAAGIVSASSLIDDRIVYIMVRTEVEARLHEVVVGHYRVFKTLPTNLDDFVGMLLLCDRLGEFLYYQLNKFGYKCSLPKKESQFSVRDSSMAADLALAIISIEKEDLKLRYVTEVLATMYGNLLYYYGGADESRAFIAKVSPGSLYDVLYSR